MHQQLAKAGTSAKQITTSAENMVGIRGGNSQSSTNVARLGNPTEQLQGTIIKVSKTEIEESPTGLTSQVGSDASFHAKNAANSAISSKAGYGAAGSVASDIADHMISSKINNTEKDMSKKPGIRVVVKLAQRNKIMTISQPDKISKFKKGEKVLVDWYPNGITRVESL